MPIKTPAQQELQALHRVRALLVTQRTAQINQLRALLLEHGLPIPQGVGALRRALPEVLEDADNGLSVCLRALMAELWQQIAQLEARISALTAELSAIAGEEASCRRLLTVPGIGPLTATALVAAVDRGQDFRRRRELAAWLGLVPRQHSTGGKPRLLGISKRGNVYLRTLLIHGARAVLRSAERRSDRLGPWLVALKGRRPANIVAVALANKPARTAWAVLMVHDEDYRPAINAPV